MKKIIFMISLKFQSTLFFILISNLIYYTDQYNIIKIGKNGNIKELKDSFEREKDNFQKIQDLFQNKYKVEGEINKADSYINQNEGTFLKMKINTKDFKNYHINIVGKNLIHTNIFNETKYFKDLTNSGTISNYQSSDYVGVAFSPYTKNWVDNNLPLWSSYKFEDIKKELKLIGTRFRTISTYSMGVASYNYNNSWDNVDPTCTIARAAAMINKEVNWNSLRMYQGIYENRDKRVMKKEIDNAFIAAEEANLIYNQTVIGLTFTSDYMNDKRSAIKILQMMEMNEERARDLNLNIGTRTGDCGLIFEDGRISEIFKEIIQTSDYIMCNLYPTRKHAKISVKDSVESIMKTFELYEKGMKLVNPKIQVIIGETGWPSEGISYNGSPNNLVNMIEFWSRMGDWASANHVQVQMFEAFDEPWKIDVKTSDPNDYRGAQGGDAHYGWWYRVADNSPKYVEKIRLIY